MYKFAQEDAVNPYNDPTDRMITAGLIGAGIGGLGGYFLPSDESENDTEDERFKKKLKNALIGMGIGGLAGTGLGYGTTELQRLREEKKIRNEEKFINNIPTAGLAGGIGAVVGGSLGAGKDLKYTEYRRAQRLAHADAVKESQRKLADFLEKAVAGKSSINRNELEQVINNYAKSKGSAAIDAAALKLTNAADFDKLGLDDAKKALDKLIKRGPKISTQGALRAGKIVKGGIGGGVLGTVAGLTIPAIVGDQFEVS